jgi:ribosomal protein S18 acetylase RimI-like enzyme
MIVRTMQREDLDAVGRLAGKLVRLHTSFDPKRFMTLANPEAGYARYLGSELASKDVVLLVGEVDGVVVGYAYARLEPRNYNELLDACGKLHDVYVEESARGHGLGAALVNEVIARLTAAGAPRVVLSTAMQNKAAQHLFEKLGFAITMHEMTREKPGV